MIRVFLLDPLGFNHIIEIDGVDVFGAENIVHHIHKDHRKTVTRQLIEMMKNNLQGEHAGCKWQRLS